MNKQNTLSPTTNCSQVSPGSSVESVVKMNFVRGTLALRMVSGEDFFLTDLKGKIQLKYDNRVESWVCDAMHYSYFFAFSSAILSSIVFSSAFF
jgi:hypothetical protein